MERSNFIAKLFLGGVSGFVASMVVTHIVPLPENFDPAAVAGASAGAFAVFWAIDEKKKDPAKKGSEVLREHLEQASPGSEEAAILAQTFIQALALEKTGEPTPPRPPVNVPDYLQEIDEKGYATTEILPQQCQETSPVRRHLAGHEYGAASDQCSVQQSEPGDEYPIAVPTDDVPDGFGGGIYPFIPTH